MWLEKNDNIAIMLFDKIHKHNEPFVYITQHDAVDPDLCTETFNDKGIIVNYYETKKN